MHLVKLYYRFVVIYFKTLIEYRFSFIVDIILQFAIFGATFLSIWLIAKKFQFVGGWSYYELVFLYNMSMVSYGLAGVVFWESMRELDFAIPQGTLDSMLVYPINPLVHLCFRHIAHSFVGNIILGGVVFAVCLQKIHIIWTVSKAVWFVLVILSGALIMFSLMLLAGASGFWLQRSNGVVSIAFFGLKNFVDYPIKIYDQGMRILLTFVVPFAFVNFYPAQYFLNKSGDYLFHPVFQFATPLVGLAFVFIAYQVWKLGLKRYESAGS